MELKTLSDLSYPDQSIYKAKEKLDKTEFSFKFGLQDDEAGRPISFDFNDEDTALDVLLDIFMFAPIKKPIIVCLYTDEDGLKSVDGYTRKDQDINSMKKNIKVRVKLDNAEACKLSWNYGDLENKSEGSSIEWSREAPNKLCLSTGEKRPYNETERKVAEMLLARAQIIFDGIKEWNELLKKNEISE